jgi:dTDP-4-dehydrorhamnose 3,5-epimerase-like enzyme
VRWDDPAFAIEWPALDVERTISERDATYPDYEA